MKHNCLTAFLLSFAILEPIQATEYFVANCGHDASCNGLASACYSGGVAPNCAKKTIQTGMDLADDDGDIVTVASMP